ncbi:hypothetical protein [Psychromonas algicola]|uniref:hypothetical protein n=1 Tax=Psychromonas algicola TaxID=2555642 RepID=UPI00106878CF|nr:hypothetical protein [Psychromonas sp. RZ5]TEW47110.1 hypothetical protein E2R67_12725 [Psychromonas sp. RZ5]
MKNILIIIVLSTLFFFIGWYSKFIDFYADVHYENTSSTQLSQFIAVSNVQITDENFACSNEEERNVGKLFAKMVGDSMSHTATTLSAGCINGTCSISYNYCKPWDMECGERILVYKIDQGGAIQTDSFTCLDLP